MRHARETFWMHKLKTCPGINDYKCHGRVKSNLNQKTQIWFVRNLVVKFILNTQIYRLLLIGELADFHGELFAMEGRQFQVEFHVEIPRRTGELPRRTGEQKSLPWVLILS